MRASLTQARRLAASRRAFSSTAAASADGKLFDKILIANRGEISCRVSRTAHRLGIKTVAIYSDPDVQGIHVKAADEAYCVGPAKSTLSYLSIPRVLEAIERTGAQAVHPGYGFLSENTKFVEELEKRKVTFIGPKASAMDALGDKIHSKKLAMAAGVNTVPGYLADIPNAEEAVKIARDIGYPVMVKASSGGGGKGMRVCYSDDEVRIGYRLSKEEAKAAFASDVVFIEKFIEEPRHIEIQLIADNHGNVVALPERECTIQRRNQKVIEESPSTFLDPKTRSAMQDQAESLAKSVGYNSAGTVEFLVDKHRNFYFLEMNTRLQVEHPVSEEITGLDLVELMIRSAAGEMLPEALRTSRPAILGHAFEARVYAEDPFRGFLPSTGRLASYVEPQVFGAEGRDPYLDPAAVDPVARPDGSEYATKSIRADAGVAQGSEISMFYDPMICKMITHGATRDGALDRLRACLDAYVIRGVGHNISFLRDLCEHPRFISGAIDTGFIKAEYPDGFHGVKLAPVQKLQMVAGAAVMNALKTHAAAGVSGASASAAAPETRRVVVSIGKKTVTGEGKAAVTTLPEVFAVELADGDESRVFEQADTPEGAAAVAAYESVPHGDGSVVAARITPLGADGKTPAGPTQTVNLGNVDWSVDSPLFLAGLLDVAPDAPDSHRTLRLQHVARHADGFTLTAYGATLDVFVRTPEAHALNAHMLPVRVRDMGRVLVSPMPGALISVAVEVGQEVEEGQEVAVVEAMKMQNLLRAPKKSKVKKVAAKAGDTLQLDQVIVEFE